MAPADNVEKGLHRGDAEMALQALVRLAPADRAPFIAPVGVLFRAAVHADHRAKNWSKLTAWASRAEKISGLEGPPGSPEYFTTAWALTWGAIKTREWQRAQRWYQPIHAALGGRSERFASAMESIVSGNAAPELLAPFLAAHPVDDPRLGHEKKRVRVDWAAPRSVDDVERTLLAMVATEPWGVFATTVTQWASKVDPGTRSRMLELGAQLAVRETVKRLTAHRDNPGAPGEFLRVAVEALGAPTTLAEESFLLFRLLAARLSTGSRTTATVREFGHVAIAASAYESLLPLVVGFVTSLEFNAEADPSFLTVLDHLLRRRPETALVGKVMVSLASAGPSRPELHRPSPALVEAVRTVIATDGEGTARWFNQVAAPVRDNLVGWLANLLPLDVNQAFVLAVWPRASALARADLLHLVETVFVKVRGAGSFNLDDWVDPLEGPLPPKARPFWNAVRALVLPQSLEFLPLALREAGDEDPIKLVELALSEKPTIEKMLRAWALLSQARGPTASRYVESEIFKRHGGDVHAMVHGVIEAHLAKLPIAFRRKLALALRDVSQSPCNCPDFARALGLANTLLKPPKPRAKKNLPKSKKKSPSPPPETGSLPF